MEKSEIKGFIAKRVAKELKDGDVVNLGIGLPTLVPAYLPEGVHVILQSENGIIGTGAKPTGADAEPAYKTDAGGSPAQAAKGGCYIDSATSFAFIRGGHVNATILGGLEVDQEHTAKGNPKILKKCTLPYTAVHCVTKIITEMCVFNVTKDGLVMTEINPEFTVDDVKAATAADFTVAEDLKDMTA